MTSARSSDHVRPGGPLISLARRHQPGGDDHEDRLEKFRGLDARNPEAVPAHRALAEVAPEDRQHDQRAEGREKADRGEAARSHRSRGRTGRTSRSGPRSRRPPAAARSGRDRGRSVRRGAATPPVRGGFRCRTGSARTTSTTCRPCATIAKSRALPRAEEGPRRPSPSSDQPLDAISGPSWRGPRPLLARAAAKGKRGPTAGNWARPWTAGSSAGDLQYLWQPTSVECKG